MRFMGKLRSKPVLDGGIMALTFFLAAFFAFMVLWHTIHFPLPSRLLHFDNKELVSALLYAEGREMHSASVSSVPPLQDFILGKTSSFSGEIPDLPSRPLTLFASSHPYLLKTIGLLWRWFGYSWWAIFALDALFFGAMIAMSYGIFRLGLNRGLSFLCSMWFMLFPSCLAMMTMTRDLSKGPFILFELLLCGYVVKHDLSKQALWALSLWAGVVIGLGMGFRADIQILLPIVILTLAVFTPWHGMRALPVRVIAVFLVIAGAGISGLPVITAQTQGNDNTGVNLVGGFSDNVLRGMGLGGTPYSLLGQSNDDWIATTAIDSYVASVDHPEPMPSYKEIYVPKQVALHYCRRLAGIFPADVLMRLYASILGVLESNPSDELLYRDFHTQEQRNLFQAAGDLGALFALHISRYGRYYAAAALILIAAKNMRWAFAAFFLLMSFIGYTSLQFGYRHIFHLGCLALWFPAFVIAALLVSAWGLRKEGRGKRWQTWSLWACWHVPSVRRSVIFGVVCCLLLAAPLVCARGYQYWRVGRLFAQLDQCVLEPIPTEEAPCAQFPNLVLLSAKRDMDAVRQPERIGITDTFSDYLVAEFDNRITLSTCEFVYEDTSRKSPLTNNYPIESWTRIENGVNRFYFPVYDTADGRNRFVGIAIRRQYIPQFRGLYRVKNREELPFTMPVTLPTDWWTVPRYATLQASELSPYVRSASCFNLLSNGDFEAWDSSNMLPLGFHTPINSTIIPETARTARGKTAICQTWPEWETSDILNQFHVKVYGLKPNFRYMFKFKAVMPQKFNCCVTIYQVVKTQQGMVPNPRAWAITLSPTDQFREYFSVFSTLPEPDSFICISTRGIYPDLKPGEKVEKPAMAIWDDWRLTELAPTPNGFVRSNP